MSHEHGFTLKHEGEEQYEYEHDDGTRVNVSFRGFDNGSRIGAHHYSADGEQMDYYRFQISQSDNRSVHYQRREDEDPPLAVIAAVHSSGWTIENVDGTALSLEEVEDDPRPFQLLNLRDHVQGIANETPSDIETAELETVADILEASAVFAVTLDKATDQSDLDPDTWARRSMSQVVKGGKSPTDMSVDEMVWGHLKSVIDPDANRRTKHHDVTVNKLELGRDLMEAGVHEDDIREMMDNIGDGNNE